MNTRFLPQWSPLLLALVLAGLGQVCLAAAPMPSVAASSPTASKTKASKSAAVDYTWPQLKPEQQQALAPLQQHWPQMSQNQKRKWLAVSKNYPSLKPEEQARLHERMSSWAQLSPQERAQARTRFTQAQQQKLSGDEKKAKWQEYQALDPEQKKSLAAKAAKPAKPRLAAPQPRASAPVSGR